MNVSSIKRVASLVLLLALAGCPQRTAVWIEPGSTASHLTFRVANRPGGSGHVAVAGLRVDPCAAAPDYRSPGAWVISGMMGTSDSTHRVTYGIVPAGFEEAHPADSLVPGCYRVTISGTGRAWFIVSEDGRVIPSKEPPRKV
jgi:hypothetical protein